LRAYRLSGNGMVMSIVLCVCLLYYVYDKYQE
jgi:hypothetical protein